MKAIKIDAEKRMIYPIEMGKGLKAIYSALSGSEVQVTNFDLVKQIAAHPDKNHTNDILVDGEALLHQKHEYGFIIDGYKQPLLGNGIVVGCNEETCDTVSVNCPIEQIQSRVRFLNQQGVNWVYSQC